MDKNCEAEDNVSEVLKVFKSLSWEPHLCLRAIHEKTKRQHSIPKVPKAELMSN